jgi:phosphoribosylanthranilate isomerase
VGRAIEVARPFGVDVSSGVEAAPGIKSQKKIEAFAEVVRAMDR